MKRACILTGILLIVAEAASAQITLPLPVMPVRKAAIDNIRVEPTPVTTATTVTCRIAVAGDVRFDKVEQRRLGGMIMLKVYWIDPDIAAASAPADHTESLGTFAPGFYSILVQSLYKGRLTDSRQVTFRVEEAPAVAPNYIENVWTEPDNPTSNEPVVLHISGEWPTSGYSMPGLQTMVIGNRITIKMHWRSPGGNVPQVVTPYEKEIEFPSLREGAYRATIYCYRDNRQVDSAQLTFDVDAPAEPEEE